MRAEQKNHYNKFVIDTMSQISIERGESEGAYSETSVSSIELDYGVDTSALSSIKLRFAQM